MTDPIAKCYLQCDGCKGIMPPGSHYVRHEDGRILGRCCSRPAGEEVQTERSGECEK